MDLDASGVARGEQDYALGQGLWCRFAWLEALEQPGVARESHFLCLCVDVVNHKKTSLSCTAHRVRQATQCACVCECLPAGAVSLGTITRL